jgi:hypothetical protein
MKKEILADKVKLEPCPDNQDVFGEKFDWGEENARKSSLSREWGSMKEDQRLEYDSIEDFFQKKSLPDLLASTSNPERNHYKYKTEIDKRKDAGEYLKYLAVDELYHENSLLELLSNTENASLIRSLYKLRKRDVQKDGLKGEEAVKLRNCIRQGTELFQAGRNGGAVSRTNSNTLLRCRHGLTLPPTLRRRTRLHHADDPPGA